MAVAMIMWAVASAGGEVRLAEKGEAKCVIVAPAGLLGTNASPKDVEYDVSPSGRRRLLTDSVRDLTLLLGKMSGAKIEVVEGLPAGEKRVPIYVGAEAQKVFGRVGASKAGLYGFRVVANSKGLGLYGESEFGTSYAIYELLHRLGCRWFMPTDLGECVPDIPKLTVSETDESLAPATESRGMWQGGTDFLRRNRLNGTFVVGSHCLEGYITQEQRAAHPEWCLQVDGKPHPQYLRWTRQDVADAVADAIIQRLDKAYAPSVSLSPGDYVVPTEDPEEMKSDPSPRVWEPAAGRWSVTDRLLLLASRVAERVGKKYPDVKFGIYLYVNYSMPPGKQKGHPNVIPMFAPIDFNRHHPMTWPNHPNQTWLLDMVQGWGKVAPRTAFRGYGMNLAELSAPNPFITKWGADIPILLKNNMVYWQPETMGGWESMLPGYYLAARMTFYPQEKPEAILQDLWTRFYGAAAEPMGRYWQTMDRAWIDAGEYAGSFHGYLRMFTPEVLGAARAAINEALKRAGKPASPEYRRVKLIDESLTLFELYMKMRRDWAAGQLANLEADYGRWRSSLTNMVQRYRDPADDTYVQGRFGTLIYPDSQLAPAYRDASRMEREYARVGAPMIDWKWKHNPGSEADSMPWTAPGYDDKDWPKTHVVRETWSTIGHHNTMTEASANKSGRMAYRASQKLSARPAGKKVFLWIGSTDGRAKVFVNGTPVKYVAPDKGEVKEAFDGYCQPSGTGFDVTAALKTGDNQFTILCERYHLNELGTGGLMGPVVLYREK
ncbi:MAG: DUF4838 domain-containing protein [Verrucomicrobiia bacterium]